MLSWRSYGFPNPITVSSARTKPESTEGSLLLACSESRCIVLADPGASFSRKASCSSAVGLNSPLTWCVYGKVFDTGLPNRLRVKFHELDDLERHTYFDRKAERFRFGSGECIIMCPISTC